MSPGLWWVGYPAEGPADLRRISDSEFADLRIEGWLRTLPHVA